MKDIILLISLFTIFAVMIYIQKEEPKKAFFSLVTGVLVVLSVQYYSIVDMGV